MAATPCLVPHVRAGDLSAAFSLRDASAGSDIYPLEPVQKKDKILGR
jgi:hypothetical protein